ncbi:helix-turn-helix domain-containing protein [Modestobacter lacusdianchii]
MKALSLALNADPNRLRLRGLTRLVDSCREGDDPHRSRCSTGGPEHLTPRRQLDRWRRSADIVRMALMTTQQAADRLGVSARHVQRLVAGGDLTAIGTDRIDAGSVAHWLAQRAGSRARAWEEPTAWAAVALLEGLPASWLGQAQRSRLRSTLSELDAVGLAARARNRAVVGRFHAHPRALSRLAKQVVGSGATRGVGDLTAADDRLDGYVADTALTGLINHFRLEADPSGGVVLRTTGMSLDVVAELADGRRRVLAGLDLAGSIDARERATGSRLLDRALDSLRG